MVLIENDTFKATLLKIGVNAERLSQLDKGFASFKYYHSSKDIAVKSANCESETFKNVFDASTYNSVLHRRNLEQFVGNVLTSPTNLDLRIPNKGTNLSSVSLMIELSMRGENDQLTKL